MYESFIHVKYNGFSTYSYQRSTIGFRRNFGVDHLFFGISTRFQKLSKCEDGIMDIGMKLSFNLIPIFHAL